MRKSILMVLLAVISNSAMAEWVWVDNGINTITYADPDTILKNGSRVKMWDLADFKTAQVLTGNPNPYMSMKERNEYDCKESQVRTLVLYFISRNMGRGKKINANNELGKWKPVPPEGLKNTLWKFACGKRSS